MESRPSCEVSKFTVSTGVSMFLHLGTSLYGKVDQVPGLFYVATRFFQLNFLPLIPLGSYLVFDGSQKGEKFAGCSIPLSVKSILFTWGRLALLLGGILMAFFTPVILVLWLENQAHWQGIPIAGGMALALFYTLYASYRFSRAGPMRALCLARAAGIAPEVVAQYFLDHDDLPGLEATPEEPELSERQMTNDY